MGHFRNSLCPMTAPLSHLVWRGKIVLMVHPISI
jgi:hypothetical protein